MTTFFAALISPEPIVSEGDVKSIVLSGVEGDMTILPGHAPLVTMLMPGFIFATDAAGKGRRAFVRGGFVEITGRKVTILAEGVYAVEELTREQIDKKIFNIQMILDAPEDFAARSQADASIGRLEEIKGSLVL